MGEKREKMVINGSEISVEVSSCRTVSVSHDVETVAPMLDEIRAPFPAAAATHAAVRVGRTPWVDKYRIGGDVSEGRRHEPDL